MSKDQLWKMIKLSPPSTRVMHNFTEEEVEYILTIDLKDFGTHQIARMFGDKKSSPFTKDEEFALGKLEKLQRILEEEKVYNEEVKLLPTVTDKEFLRWINEVNTGDWTDPLIHTVKWHRRRPECNKCGFSNDCVCKDPCIIHITDENGDSEGNTYVTCKKCTCRNKEWRKEHGVYMAYKDAIIFSEENDQIYRMRSELVEVSFEQIQNLIKRANTGPTQKKLK